MVGPLLLLLLVPQFLHRVCPAERRQDAEAAVDRRLVGRLRQAGLGQQQGGERYQEKEGEKRE